MRSPYQATAAPRRTILAVAILALALGGCAGTSASATPAPTAAVSATPLATPAPTPSQDTAVAPPNGPDFSPISFKGKGKRVVKFKIPLDSAALAEATHAGSGTFSITSVGADGAHNDVLVNTIGKYTGTVLFDDGIDQHSVAFQVQASGSWTIVIKPIANARKWNGSGTLKGTGDDVVQISPASSGPATLGLTFKGKDDFAITSYSPDGGELLANETGNFTGKVVLPDGSFLLSVSANGETWSAKAG